MEAAMPASEAEPDRPGQRRDGRREESGGQHLAFEADVENPRPFGEKPGKTGEQQRRRKAHRAVQKLDERHEIHQPRSLRSIRNMRSSGIRTMLSSAPVKRITSAWITTINSRGILVQSASSAPPW